MRSGVDATRFRLRAAEAANAHPVQDSFDEPVIAAALGASDSAPYRREEDRRRSSHAAPIEVCEAPRAGLFRSVSQRVTARR